jgi:crotonobetainyl-CoA:carnitine CoA-transferase CaiB-like acyl-CoA transferase
VTVQHPTAGRLDLIGSPIRIDGMRPPEAPPLLGQHTAEVLAEVGISNDEIDALKARGAVAMPG